MADENWRAVELHYTDSQIKRFGPDEADDADIPKSLQYDTQIPGGFGPGSCVLPRPPKLRADDAALFSHARVYGPGGRTYHEGRITGIPQVGANEIRLDLEGWSAHLDDDETFREIYSDIDLSHWGSISAQRKINLIAAGFGRITDSSVMPDTSTGAPALVLAFDGSVWAGGADCEAQYDAGGGCSIGSLYVAGKEGHTGDAGDWHWYAVLAPDDVYSSSDKSADLRGATWATTLAATLENRRFALVQYYFEAANGTDQAEFQIYHTCVAVVGNHGLTLRGTADATNAQGFYASDILGHALSKSAPLLSYTLGDSIEQSTFAIPHLVFLENTTVRSVVEQITALGGAQLVPNDWGVYENREFFWKTPGTYGKTWRVRKDQFATPLSEGPESKERINGMKISYRDGAGTTHSVGPPGSGSDYETTDLLDTDPQNPANRLSRKWKHREVGITNQEGALLIGQLLLAEANLVDWRGTVEVKGEATDDAGNTYPVDMMRAGDRVVTEDDEYPTERPVNSTSYQHDSMTDTVNIGAPPHRGEVLLAQLAAATDLIA